MLSVVADERARAELQVDLDELLRKGARRMLAAALEAEVDAYIAAYQSLHSGPGKHTQGPVIRSRVSQLPTKCRHVDTLG
jgi:hypothetical protein